MVWSTPSSAPFDLLAARRRLRTIRDHDFGVDERWIYVAGCNVPADDTGSARVREEIESLRYLLDRAAVVSVLSHQEQHGRAEHLDRVAALLRDALHAPTTYEPDLARAVHLSRTTRGGALVVAGNTRFHAGEKDDDADLARRFAELGDYTAVGGFSKAHRRHASNSALLEIVPCYAAFGLAAEVQRVAAWGAERVSARSVAVVGGTKPEKVLLGLPTLARSFTTVIPAGAVLHAVMVALGMPIGGSMLPTPVESVILTVRELLQSTAAPRLLLPDYVTVAAAANLQGRTRRVPLGDRIASSEAIVDIPPSPRMQRRLSDLTDLGGDLLIAGTPSLASRGQGALGQLLIATAASVGVRSIAFGGDTVRDLDWRGETSTGGGAALQLLAEGTLPMLRPLERHAA